MLKVSWKVGDSVTTLYFKKKQLGKIWDVYNNDCSKYACFSVTINHFNMLERG